MLRIQGHTQEINLSPFSRRSQPIRHSKAEHINESLRIITSKHVPGKANTCGSSLNGVHRVSQSNRLAYERSASNHYWYWTGSLNSQLERFFRSRVLSFDYINPEINPEVDAVSDELTIAIRVFQPHLIEIINLPPSLTARIYNPANRHIIALRLLNDFDCVLDHLECVHRCNVYVHSHCGCIYS